MTPNRSHLPTDALGRADPRVGVPRAPGMASAIDDWLADIGRRVYATVGYSLGLIGHEVSGEAYAAGPPEQRAIGYLVPDNGHLRYGRPTGRRTIPCCPPFLLVGIGNGGT